MDDDAQPAGAKTSRAGGRTNFVAPYVGGTQLQWMRPLIITTRWALLVPATLLELAVQGPSLGLVVGVALLTGFATWRSWDLFAAQTSLRLVVVLEAVVAVIAIVLTGELLSPFMPLLMLPIFSAGLSAGMRGAVPLTVGSIGIIAGVQYAVLGNVDNLDTVVPIVVPAALVGVLGRMMVLRVAEDYQSSLGPVQDLAGINDLLTALTGQVRSLPVARKTADVVQQVRDRVLEEFAPDGLALLVHERDQWRPTYVEGMEIAATIPHRSLPRPLLDRGPFAGAAVSRFAQAGLGLAPGMQAGVYQWLWARGAPVGLLAMEYREPDGPDGIDLAALERLAIPLALALDNAQWFERLHTLGVEEERQRIGGQLHDHFAQSLAFVGIELDRVVRRYPDDADIARVREHVRDTLGELRETMRDLRVRVTEERPLAEVLADELERFGDRYGVMTELLLPEVALKRFPLPVEQQFLRIVQELLVQAVREDKATSVDVWLAVDDDGFLLAIDDDGAGRPEEELGADARERLEVVRARADAIGAEVVRRCTPGQGASARVFLPDVTSGPAVPSRSATTTAPGG